MTQPEKDLAAVLNRYRLAYHAWLAPDRFDILPMRCQACGRTEQTPGLALQRTVAKLPA